MNIAYTAHLENKPNKDGMHYRLVLADGSGGFNTLKESGDPDPNTGVLRDPFYLAKGPIWFKTREACIIEANRRNELELGLTMDQATEIIARSMTATMPEPRTVARGSIGTRFD